MKALGIGKVTQGEDGPRRVRKTERCVEGVQAVRRMAAFVNVLRLQPSQCPSSRVLVGAWGMGEEAGRW